MIKKEINFIPTLDVTINFFLIHYFFINPKLIKKNKKTNKKNKKNTIKKNYVN